MQLIVWHTMMGLPAEQEPSGDGGHLPFDPRSIRPVPASQLTALEQHGSMTTMLDVHPHTHCGRLDLPNLETLRLFYAPGGVDVKSHWGCENCPALAALRPRTLVVFASTPPDVLLISLLSILPIAHVHADERAQAHPRRPLPG